MGVDYCRSCGELVYYWDSGPSDSPDQRRLGEEDKRRLAAGVCVICEKYSCLYCGKPLILCKCSADRKKKSAKSGRLGKTPISTGPTFGIAPMEGQLTESGRSSGPPAMPGFFRPSPGRKSGPPPMPGISTLGSRGKKGGPPLVPGIDRGQITRSPAKSSGKKPPGKQREPAQTNAKGKAANQKPDKENRRTDGPPGIPGMEFVPDDKSRDQKQKDALKKEIIARSIGHKLDELKELLETYGDTKKGKLKTATRIIDTIDVLNRTLMDEDFNSAKVKTLVKELGAQLGKAVISEIPPVSAVDKGVQIGVTAGAAVLTIVGYPDFAKELLIEGAKWDFGDYMENTTSRLVDVLSANQGAASTDRVYIEPLPTAGPNAWRSEFEEIQREANAVILQKK